MKKLYLFVMILGLAGLITAAQPDSAAEPTILMVVLPEEVVVDASIVLLSSVCRLDGSPSLMDKARLLTVGTFVAKGQVLCLDHKTIAGRLASIGIGASCVEFSGAEMVKIKRRELVIESEKITELARLYLEKQLAGQKVVSLSIVRKPSPITLGDPNVQPELTCRMNRYQTPGSTKIDVIAGLNGIEVERSQVIFSVRYKAHQAVAIEMIESGQEITADNVQMQEVETVSPEQKNNVPPYGMTARRKIVRGAVIHPDSVALPKTAVLIRRNQQVMVQIDTGSLFLSAPGQALDEGRVGDLIRVRRGQRPEEMTIYATVQPDGTVRPQL